MGTVLESLGSEANDAGKTAKSRRNSAVMTPAMTKARRRYTRCVMPTRNRGMAKSLPPPGIRHWRGSGGRMADMSLVGTIVLLVYRQAGYKKRAACPKIQSKAPDEHKPLAGRFG